MMSSPSRRMPSRMCSDSMTRSRAWRLRSGRRTAPGGPSRCTSQTWERDSAVGANLSWGMERAFRVHPRSDKPWAAAIPSRVIVKSLSQRRARSGLCVTRIVVIPRSRRAARGADRTPPAEAGVEIAGRLVGEQQAGGRGRGRAQIATRCCSPPESARAPCVAPIGETDARAGARRAVRSASDFGTPAMRCGIVTFSRAVNSGSRWWNWKTKPIFSLRKRARARGGQLVDGLAEDLDAALVRPVDAAEQMQQGRLPDARRPHHGGERPGRNLEGEMGEDLHRGALAGVGLGEVFGLDREHRRRPQALSVERCSVERTGGHAQL